MKEILISIYDFVVTLCLMLYSSIACLARQIVPYKYRCKSVKNEICLVTGAGSGIGKLMAKKFAKLGCRLILVDINQKDNEQTANEILVDGGFAKAFRVDLSSREQIYKFAEEVRIFHILKNIYFKIRLKEIFQSIK